MRISDWSSDVCSSDLGPGPGGIGIGDADADRPFPQALAGQLDQPIGLLRVRRGDRPAVVVDAFPHLLDRIDAATRLEATEGHLPRQDPGGGRAVVQGARNPRSEEHTSELQSLMRISYAVFCLKKKTTT